mmetsp:Transcript_7115/g.17982  ORF Transcript_7115/g.17982 Transcript_7115/m.17982 type:complete len:671 (-) Transcript_7115:475-2487(-)
MGDPNDAFDPIAFLETQMDMKKNPRDVRATAVKSMKNIAANIGPDKVQTDLIPLICTLIPEEEDEILFLLAKELGGFVTVVGGPACGYMLLQCFELMCDTEETVVRDAAAAAFASVTAAMEWNTEAKEKCLSMVKNLSAGDWFTKKVVAAQLYSTPYLSCDDEPYRAELRAEFKKLAEGKDELPMVKRSCATALKSLAVAAAKTDNATAVLRDDIMSTLQIYLKDKDSSVRVNATDALVGLIEGWCAIDTDSAKMCWVFTNAFVLEAINDDSWRVRHALMKGYGTIATSYVKSFGAEADPEHKTQVEKFLVMEGAPIEKAFDDMETEVRVAAVKASTVLGDALGGSVLAKSVVIPCMAMLGEVNVQTGVAAEAPTVRIAVTQGLIDLLAVEEMPSDLLGPTITSSLHTGDEPVLIGVMRSLEKGMLNKERPLDFNVFGPEQPLGPLLEKLIEFQSAEIADDWRIRKISMTLFSIMMAGCKKAEAAWLEPFQDQLGASMRVALGDYIAQVRVGAIECLPRLSAAFGLEWVKSNCLAELRKDIESDPFYQFHLKDAMEKPAVERERGSKEVALHSKWITYFASLRVLISEQIDSETAAEWSDVLCTGVEVTTPNVRFNAMLAMGELAKVADDDLLQSKLKPAITTMANEDVDDDCKYFAKQQLAEINSNQGY